MLFDVTRCVLLVRNHVFPHVFPHHIHHLSPIIHSIRSGFSTQNPYLSTVFTSPTPNVFTSFSTYFPYLSTFSAHIYSTFTPRIPTIYTKISMLYTHTQHFSTLNSKLFHILIHSSNIMAQRSHHSRTVLEWWLRKLHRYCCCFFCGEVDDGD